jgi:hypothetical protein
MGLIAGDESDGIFGGRRPTGLSLEGAALQVDVDVACVEQPQTSQEKRSMKYYAGLDVSTRRRRFAF